MSNVDYNRISADVVTSLITEFLKSLRDSSSTFLKGQYEYLTEDFSPYLESTLLRCTHVRTIINKDKSFLIGEIYIGGQFSSSSTIYTDQDVIQKIRDGENIILVGLGGAGKTVFSKYMWKSIFDSPQGKIPVFVELRRLNSITSTDLLSFLRITIGGTSGKFDDKMFRKFCSDGRFIFILDGFDEITDAKKEEVASQLVDISYEYPQNSFVVSSRHNNLFHSWANFTRFKAVPFDKKRVVDLVKLVPFDKNVKRQFLKEVVEKKYNQYESFLSTPLLCIMMMMTYSQFTDVPEKKSVFYRYAFMTLHSLHDSYKENFRRNMKAVIALDDFERVFSIFCMITYANQMFEFDSAEMRRQVSRAQSLANTKFDVDRLIGDITESVNLMFQDGDVYLFTHRSFQEYFTAFAILNSFAEKMDRIVPSVRYYGDTVLSLMYEMNESSVNNRYILPGYEKCRTHLEDILKDRNPRSILTSLEYRIYVNLERGDNQSSFVPSVVSGWPRSSTWQFIQTVEAFCITEDVRRSVAYDLDHWDLFIALSKKILKHLKASEEDGVLAVEIDFSAGAVTISSLNSVESHDIDKKTIKLDEIPFSGDERENIVQFEERASSFIKSRIVEINKVIRNIVMQSNSREVEFDDFIDETIRSLTV